MKGAPDRVDEYDEREREKERERERERERGMEVREGRKEGRKEEKRRKGGSNWEERGYRVCISPSLCPHCARSSRGWSATEKKSRLV